MCQSYATSMAADNTWSRCHLLCLASDMRPPACGQFGDTVGGHICPSGQTPRTFCCQHRTTARQIYTSKDFGTLGKTPPSLGICTVLRKIRRIWLRFPRQKKTVAFNVILRLAVLVVHRLVTDRQTRAYSIYHACIALRGKNKQLFKDISTFGQRES